MATLFPTAMRLIDYLLTILPTVRKIDVIVNDNDSNNYKELVNTTMIVPDNNNILVVNENYFDCISTDGVPPIRDIVNRTVATIARTKQSYREQNCLAIGYRRKSSRGDITMRSNIDLECYHVNTVQALVVTQSWQLLANRIGKDYYGITR